MHRDELADVSLYARDQYLREVREIQPISKGEEEALLVCWLRGRDERVKAHPCGEVLSQAYEARNRLVVGYQWIVMQFARQFFARCRGLGLLDLVQEGNLGVLEALDRYDPQMSPPLEAYIAGYVRGSMLTALRSFNGSVYFPRRAYSTLRDVHFARQREREALGRDPSFAEIAARLEISVESVAEVESWHACWAMESLHAMTDEQHGGIEEDHRLLVSVFQGPETYQEDRRSARARALYEAIETVLSPAQREALLLRHGLVEGVGDGLTFPQIGQLLNKSASNVQGTESLARKRLRESPGLRAAVSA